MGDEQVEGGKTAAAVVVVEEGERRTEEGEAETVVNRQVDFRL